MKNPANEIKDMMWNFLKDGQQKANMDELQELVYLLIKAMTQKTAGQRKNRKNDVNINRVDMIIWQIAMEAMCLVLDKRFDEVKKVLNKREYEEDA